MAEATEHPHLAARINTRAVYVLYCLCLLAAHAGGLGIAPLMAIAGVIGLATAAISQGRQGLDLGLKPARWMIALLLFLLWAAISASWSDYTAKGLSNPVKLLIGAVFYIFGMGAFFRAAKGVTKRGVGVIVIATFIAAILLCLDTLTGYRLSMLVDPVGPNEDPISRLGDAQMNVSQGIIMANLVFAPIATLLLWTQRRGPWMVAALIILNITAAVAGGIMAGVLALVLTITAMGFAAIRPTAVIKTLTYVSMGLVGFAPLFGALMGAVPQSVRDALPFSWEHRLVTWGYSAELTRAAPIRGHGFDASRTFNATFEARGFEGLAKISLHPHNAGLQIWLETGAIGALLAVITIFFIGQKAQDFASGGRARAVAVAGTMAAVILIASVSYGVWQDWWWALIALSTGLLGFVPKTRRNYAPIASDKGKL
ncbi:O-antigen ligase family protein [Fretibacter rubidus]|uniref:O-antigen ligase family protein n=1 Tax=Fretibacter rubidus TaxID=570162 RepID=UPI00352B9D70